MADKETIALVLSGGGAKGAFQVGAVKTLFDCGYRFDVISGVSVGALNGAMLAANQFGELERLWQTITKNDILKSRSLLSIARQFLVYKIGLGDPPRGLNSNIPLKELMSKYMLGKKIKTPFYFGFVKLESGVYVDATIQRNGHAIDEDDILRILASTAIPVKFDPVNFYNQTLVDGGIRNISPIAQVLPYNPDKLIIIPTEPLEYTPKDEDINDIIQIAKRSLDVILQEIFKEDINRFKSINRLVGQAKQQNATLCKSNGTPYKFIDAHIIAPAKALGDSLDFSRTQLDKNYELGKYRAEEVLKGTR